MPLEPGLSSEKEKKCLVSHFSLSAFYPVGLPLRELLSLARRMTEILLAVKGVSPLHASSETKTNPLHFFHELVIPEAGQGMRGHRAGLEVAPFFTLRC